MILVRSGRGLEVEPIFNDCEKRLFFLYTQKPDSIEDKKYGGK
jgi:hypothetical protein